MADQPHDLETEDSGPREPGHPAPARPADVLMGLPDRARFVARVEEALTAAAGTETVAVLFIDLDGFKRINAALGQWSGDDLLTLLATRLRETLQPAGMVTRFGGDEFLVLLGGIPGADDAQAGARRVLGVGHRSFAQLAHLPVALLKLDRALTACVDDPRDHAVIAAIPPMVDALRIDAVAEGVETAVQAKDLWMLGYRFAQGFHFARPADAPATRGLLAGRPPGPGDARHLGQA
jgi:predicted signal transduction protein with EAL and GGDEF domain